MHPLHVKENLNVPPALPTIQDSDTHSLKCIPSSHKLQDLGGTGQCGARSGERVGDEEEAAAVVDSGLYYALIACVQNDPISAILAQRNRTYRIRQRL